VGSFFSLPTIALRFRWAAKLPTLPKLLGLMAVTPGGGTIRIGSAPRFA